MLFRKKIHSRYCVYLPLSILEVKAQTSNIVNALRGNVMSTPPETLKDYTHFCFPTSLDSGIPDNFLHIKYSNDTLLTNMRISKHVSDTSILKLSLRDIFNLGTLPFAWTFTNSVTGYQSKQMNLCESSVKEYGISTILIVDMTNFYNGNYNYNSIGMRDKSEKFITISSLYPKWPKEKLLNKNFEDVFPIAWI